jgi:hypothetical protein
MKRAATTLVLGWLLWVEMESPETHVWRRVDRMEFSTSEACELQRKAITASAQSQGAGTSFMMSGPTGVGHTFIVDGDRVRISVCMATSLRSL